MNNSQKAKKEVTSAKSKWHKKPWFAAAVIVAILLGLYGFAELAYQGDISAMRNGIGKAKVEVATPKGGTEKSTPTVTHGAHVIDRIGCVDTNCPQVEATWQVPLATDEVAQFKADVATAIKNKESSDIFFDRTKWQVNVFTSAATDIQDTAPSGKGWQIVHIFVTE
jgi:hypothetical protein